jgi:hypothetical protein
MGNVEYRVEYIHFDNSPDAASQSSQLVEKLNDWGRAGWTVANIDLTPHPWFGPPTRPVLLVRDAPADSMTTDGTSARIGTGVHG